MAIQLPKLERFAATKKSPTARIKGQALDTSKIIGERIGAIQDVTGKFLAAKKGYEDQEIETLGIQAENQYNDWSKAKLRDIGKIEDDPRKAYAEYELEENKFVDSLVGKHPDLNERVRTGLATKMEQIRGNRRNVVLDKRYGQIEVWKDKEYKLNMKNKKSNQTTLSSHVNAGDPNSFKVYDDGMDQIKTQFSKRALQNGTAKVAPKGTKASHSFVTPSDEPGGKPIVTDVIFTNLGNTKLAAELSETLSNSVQALTDLDRFDDARALQKQYADNIDGDSNAKLNEGLEKGEFKVETTGTANRISLMPIEKQRDAVNKITNPVKREEIDKKVDANNRRIDHTRTRKNKKFYNNASKYLNEKENDGTLFLSASDMDNDFKFSEMVRQIEDPTMVKALRERVIQPKDSSPKSVMKMQDLQFDRIQGVSIVGMSPEVFATYQVGLDKTARIKSQSVYDKRNTQTQGQNATMYKTAGTFLRQQMFLKGIIGQKEFGNYKKNDEKKIIRAEDELMDFLQELPETNDNKVLKDHVKEWVTNKKKGEIYHSKSLKTNPIVNAVEARQIAKDPLAGMDNKSISKLQRAYKNEHGMSKPPAKTSAKFLEWVSKGR